MSKPVSKKALSRVIFKSLLFFILCLLAVPAPAGKIYKWRDEQGRLHFSDTAPQESSQQEVEQFYEPASPTPVNKPQTETEPPEKSAAPEPKKNDISIPFVSREGTANRVIINVTFNNRVTAPILVDTGSPGLMLSASLANRLGLFNKNSSSLMVLVSGIGGTQRALRTIVEEISIGGITEKFIPTHIVADMSDAYEGLIGMDILSSYTLTIDSSNNRLIANLAPEAKNLPGGRNRSWWVNTFREFGAYRDLLDTHTDLCMGNKYPYSKMADSKREDYKKFLLYTRGEARDLYQRLQNYARWNRVPTNWRQ